MSVGCLMVLLRKIVSVRVTSCKVSEIMLQISPTEVEKKVISSKWKSVSSFAPRFCHRASDLYTEQQRHGLQC